MLNLQGSGSPPSTHATQQTTTVRDFLTSALQRTSDMLNPGVPTQLVSVVDLDRSLSTPDVVNR